MKKTKPLFLIPVLLSALVLFSCGKTEEKVPDGIYDIGDKLGIYNITDGGMAFCFEINDNYINVYEPADTVNAYQSFLHSGIFDLEYAKSNFVFADINSDGYGDFTIPCENEDGHIKNYSYLWNEGTKQFEETKALSDLYDIKICDGYITANYYDNGIVTEGVFYWDNGEVKNKKESDKYVQTALSFAEGILNKDSLRCEFAQYDIIDRIFCKKFSVFEGEEIIGYIEVSYSFSRVFYAEVQDSYAEVKEDGDRYLVLDSYTHLYTDDFEECNLEASYGRLDSTAKSLFGYMYEKCMEGDTFNYSSASAVSAAKALIDDNPVINQFYDFTLTEDTVSSFYKDKYSSYTKSQMAEAINNLSIKYDTFANDVASSFKTVEKTEFIAQYLQMYILEGREDEILLDGQTREKQIINTLQLLYQKKSLPLSREGDTLTVNYGGESRIIYPMAAFEFPMGSEEWQKAFFGQ